MTTSVIIQANHGWPVRVRNLHPITRQSAYPDTIVPAGEERTVYIHSDLDIEIHEIQPGEDAAPLTDEAADV